MPRKLGKAAQEKADAAYLRTETLRGQIDWLDGIQGDSPPERIAVEGIPDRCPKCDRAMNRPSDWTHMMRRAENIAANTGQLQCGNCAAIVVVSFDCYEKVREDSLARFKDKFETTKKVSSPKRKRDHDLD